MGFRTSSRKKYIYRSVAREISTFSSYYDKFIQWDIPETDPGSLFEEIICPEKKKLLRLEELPDLSSEKEKRTIILIDDALNRKVDFQQALADIRTKVSRTARIVAVVYNPYPGWLSELKSTAKLSGFQVVRARSAGYLFAKIVVFRPVIAEKEKPSISVIIPARNEKGNIENVLKKMPDFSGAEREIIFIEAHSKDGTWEEIQRVQKIYSSKFKIKAFQQEGRGKSDAVRLGCSRATCDLIVILDADLTVPPEKLLLFYDAYCAGLADFINGNRLVYSMEDRAMKALNRVGNVISAKAVSFVLDVPLGDTLCGTKLFTRHDYKRFSAWRENFGDLDPFGDFELLFPAAILSLGITDIPVHYLARKYGTSNIRRFRHTLMLIKMVFVGFFRIKL
ncbi:MAG: glycosyltransferase family 2 protein [Candidatus Omnitrophota bacterium]